MDSAILPAPTPGTPVPYTWVATPATFREMLGVLAPVPRLAIDMEADSLYHYFEKVCLIQISTDSVTFILDTLALGDLSALAPLMADSGIEKVLHAASYDVICLRRDYGFALANLFDTHIAAQLLGYPFLGLATLLENLLGVSHSKRRQRDDWSRRPLDSEQLEYAALDTHHLLRLRDILEEQLSGKGRLPWAREEFAIAASTQSEEKVFDPEGFRRIKGSRDLSPQQLAILRALYLLRDSYARELDLPPFKILNNPVLVDLARHPPKSPQAMTGRAGISHRVARRYGAEIYRVIKRAQSEDPCRLGQPPPREWKPQSRAAKARLENLRGWRRAKALALGLDVGVVFPGSLLETIAADPPPDLAALENMAGMRRWRAREFGEELLQALSVAEAD